MRHRPISALLLCSAIALPFSVAASDLGSTQQPNLILAQADASDDSNPLAPFLKRTTPAVTDTEEEVVEEAVEDAAEEVAEEVVEETPAEPAEEVVAEDDNGIEDLPRKSLPKSDPVVAEEDATEQSEPEVVIETVREPTSMATISPNALYDIIGDHVDMVEVDPSGGDTTLEGRIDGTSFQVYFYECDGGDMSSVAYPDSDCLGFEWRSYFFEARPSARQVNEWNANYHYGKLFIDRDGDLTVQLNVVVEGGIEERNVLTTLAWFRAVLDGVRSEFR
ncbi:MAG: YbjN domain-containing protein [Pseudomonadota bacterium]